ncbi:M13 family metallopeptidase [Phenylobacterium sp.]|uniref:M13 family metallopeptidase n=1 Tax=Phenylobacterium sp. TaxID=1871053 RepID=UPI0025E0F48D|nr:M13 family metallopeptidase [Phenylobacterium sp.]
MTFTRRALGAALLATPAMGAAPAALAAAMKGKTEYGDFGIDLAAVDPAVAPGDDFFRHVSGAWLKTATIPPDRSSWGAGARINENTQARTRAIMESAGALGTANGRKIADYYAAWIDEPGLERRGTEPLKPELARIAAIATPADLARELALLSWAQLPNPNGSQPLPPSPLASGVAVDIKQPDRYVSGFTQGGIGLPDRDYYLVDAPANVKARQAYKAHLTRMFALVGFDDAEGRAGRVYALEERIARGHRTRVANREAEKRYNPFTRADFAARAPGVDWDAYLKAAGLDGQSVWIVNQPEATAAAAAAAADVPLADWRDYLAFRAIRNFAPIGPKAFREEDFDYNGRVLSGTPEMPAAWKTAVIQTDRALGQAVGEIYLQRHFPPASRAQITDMTRNLKLAMAKRIRALDWMTPQTKARALAKLQNLRVEVGGQQPLRDYSRLEVVASDGFGNLLRAQAFDRARQLGKLGRPVDRSEWSMNPQTINAQSNSVLIKVMFPAGYLQPPNFDPNADPAVNYGAIGRVIGHEISHQFDDQGSKFDEKGALNNWWTPQDLAKFQAAAAGLAAQYDAYEPLPGLHINGRLTLGENIGDLAGLAMAYDAYHASLGGRPAPVLGGLTGDQRFFMSFAQTHRSLQRENALRQQLLTDPHSPNEWRSAEVRNVDAWYAAFDVKPGQKMYLPPDRRVRVW